MTVIASKTAAVFPAGGDGLSLATMLRQLLHQQRQSWPRLAEGHRALADIEQRDIDCGDYRVTLQHNPRRITSTGAKVDAATIDRRQCFLCLKHLPAPQKGVLYRDEFIILCNPNPIFRAHFTISHQTHVPQSWSNAAERFLELSRDLSPDFSVLYNGPKCGASAPDHLHFQACTSQVIPVERQAANPHWRGPARAFGEATMLALKDLGRAFVVVEGSQPEGVRQLLQRCVGGLAELSGQDGEPLFNVLGGYHAGRWRIILMPRRRHRPTVYELPEPDRIMISPGTVDLGGIVITPRAADYARVDAEMLRQIFREVSFDDQIVCHLVSAL